MNLSDTLVAFFNRLWPRQAIPRDMTRAEIYESIIYRQPEFLTERALSRSGYGGDGFGVTYPVDLDEHDREMRHTSIPDGQVRLDYWDGENLELLVPEAEYLNALADRLIARDRADLAAQVQELARSLSGAGHPKGG